MRLLFGIIVIVMVLLSGCNVEEPVDKVENENGNVQQEEKQKDQNQVFKVGEVVKIGDTELIIKTAKLEKPEQYVPANKGNVLVLEIEGKNNGSQSWHITSGDFNLYDTNGQKSEEYFSGQDPSVFGGEVNQGKKISGKVRFDVPEADSYELIYKPNFLTNQEIKFDIEPTK